MEETFDASATRAAVLEDRLDEANALDEVADSMAKDEDFLTELDASCEEWVSCFCC